MLSMQGQVSACACVQAFTDQPQSLLDNPSNTGQLAAGVAGLLAVPVVAWSEYILKTTGNVLVKLHLMQHTG